MEKFYTLGIGVICFIIIRKLFSLLNNKIKTTEEWNEPILSAKKVVFSDEHVNNTDFNNKEPTVADGNIVEPIIITENKWLYPDDHFGNLIKGTVYNCETYDIEINDNNSNEDKMKIRTIKKKKNNSK